MLAAERAGLDSVPCGVCEMDDATAYIELVRANAQSELTAPFAGIRTALDPPSRASSMKLQQRALRKPVPMGGQTSPTTSAR